MLFRSSHFQACLFSAALATLAVACGGSPAAPTPATLKVTSVTPASGSVSGGTLVTIGGTEFGADAAVTVGGIAATQITLLGSTALTAVIGARPNAGAADVVVTSGGKTAALANSFTYVSPSGSNTAPVITGIRSTGTRTNQPANFGDVGETLTLTATVSDNETSADRLSFKWSGPGSFAQNAATTAWTIPADYTPTPSQVTVTLTVTETYTEGAVTHTNVSAPATYVLNVHNSQEEILTAGEDFLARFAQSNIPTADVLRNFSTTCDDGSGRAEEKADVDRNRDEVIEDFAAYRIQRRGPVTFAFGGGFCQLPDGRQQRRIDACSSFAVHFEDVNRRTGARGGSEGVDYISAVLENNQWRLCHSSYISTGRFPSVRASAP